MLSRLFCSTLFCLCSVLTEPLHAQNQFNLKEEDKKLSDLLEQSPLTPLDSSFRLNTIEVIGSNRQTLIQTVTLLQEGQQVNSQQLQEALKRVSELGYFSEVKPIKILEKNGFKLLIYVKENPILKQIILVSKPNIFSEKIILSYFKNQMGITGNFNDIRRAKESIEQLYKEKGYSLAQVGILQPPLLQGTNRLIDFDGKLQLQINEGIIEALEVSGNQESHASIILREFPFKSGDIFHDELAQQALQRLYRTQWFKNIHIIPLSGKINPNHIILNIVVEEDQTLLLNYGGGYNFRDGLTGSFDMSKENLGGRGQRLGLNIWAGLDVFNLTSEDSLNTAQRSLFGRIDFFDPWFFSERTALGASFFSQRVPLFFGQNISLGENLNLGNGILQTKTGFTLSTNKPLFKPFNSSPWKAGLQFKAEQILVTDLNRLPRPELTTSKRLNGSDHIFSLQGTLNFDSRNDFINPTKGWFGNLNIEHVWGDANYQKVQGTLSYYLSLTDWLTLATGINSGAYIGNNPIYEQFFSNGMTVIRGWRENGFLHGNQFLIGSLEARFPIFNPVSGVIFTDIGEFFPLNRQTSALNHGLPFKYGVGLGIRVNTPIGLIRLDYGVRHVPLFNWSQPFENGQIHFSLGQKF